MRVIVKGPYTPTKQIDSGQNVEIPLSEWEEKKKLASINVRAINIFYCGLNAEEINKLFTVKTLRIFYTLLSSYIRTLVK